MKHQVNKGSKKQRGFVMTSELVLLTTTMVIGMLVGLTTLRDAATSEMEDVAEAIGSLNQSYAFDGMINAEDSAEVTGSAFNDAVDANSGDGAAFTFVAPPATEGENVNSNAGTDLTSSGTQQ